jgi:hypothetical protein
MSLIDLLGIINTNSNLGGDTFQIEYAIYTSNNLYKSLYDTDINNSNIFNNKFNLINTDTIIQGSSNRFIINDTYNRDIFFNNSLTSSNIITSNLKIINNTTSTPLIIKQLNTSYNIAEFYNNTNPAFIISSNGFIGINKISNIQERLDIDGNLKIKGNIYPENDITYDLGTSNNRFRDLYLSGNSINLDNLLISKNINNNLEIKDNEGNYKNVNLNQIELNNGGIKLSFQLDNEGNLIYKKYDSNTGTNFLYPAVYDNQSETSNSVSSNIMVNYVANTSNDLFINNSNLSLTNSNNLANYTSNNSNYFSNISLTNSNNLADYILNNSNYFSNVSLTNSNNLADYILNNSNYFSNVSLKNSNNLLVYTSNNLNILDNKFNSINTDTIIQGSSNRFIINDIYNRDITFTNTLSSSNIITSNLNVIGDSTILNTTIYQTEQLQVVNDTTATALIVKQINSNKNVAEFYYQNNELGLIINSNGNIGIGIPNPLNKFDVIGNINSSTISINNIDILTTISNNSNNLANYTSNISLTNSNNLANYILNNSNYFSNVSLTNSNNLANYTSNVSLTNSNNLANYFFNVSLTNSNNLANYILNNSNYFSNVSLTNSNNLSIYTSNISLTNSNNVINYFSNISLTNSNNLANYTSNNSNLFNNRLATLNINTDTIIQGSSNRFIVNDIYNRSVSFTGNFLTSTGIINSYDTINFYSSITPASLTWSARGVSALGVANTSNQLSSNASAGDMVLRSDSNNKLILQNGSNKASLIISNNFIGIGTTTPLYNLDVNSNINSYEYFIKNLNISNIFVSSNVFVNNSNILFNYSSNNSNTFNTRLANLNINTDTITQGSSNRFIVNDIYNRDITFTNSLTSSNIITSNLSVIGDNTTFNTTIYQTEQLQVVNDTTATALIVKQVNSSKNVAEFYYQNNKLGLIINSNGNIGIGITNPLNKLDISGNVNSSDILINGTSIQTTITNNSNNLFTIINDSYCKKTTFYFTPYISYIYNSITYYTYNIEISKFVRFIQLSSTIKLAKFRIHIAPVDSNFNGTEIRECEYLIMMSDLNGDLSVRAIGTPQDTYLQKIQSWKIVKSSSITYLTYISPIQNINILCSIIDEA